MLDGWQLDLDVLFDDRQVLNHELSWMEPPDDDPATLLDELVVFSWKTLYVGRLAGTCPDGPPYETRCAEHELEEAWMALEDARAVVDDKRAAVDDARAALENTQGKIARDILSAQEAVEKAENALAADEESGSGPDRGGGDAGRIAAALGGHGRGACARCRRGRTWRTRC